MFSNLHFIIQVAQLGWCFMRNFFMEIMFAQTKWIFWKNETSTPTQILLKANTKFGESRERRKKYYHECISAIVEIKNRSTENSN